MKLLASWLLAVLYAVGYVASAVVFAAVLCWLALCHGYASGPARRLTIIRDGEG